MTNSKVLLQQTDIYIQKHRNTGGACEFDKSINDISRDRIQAMKEENGSCWLFKFNVYPEDKPEPTLVEYTGQMIYNFDYSGAIPVYDQQLISLLEDYHKDSGYPKTIMSKIEKIMDRLYEVNGINLFWA